MGTLPPAPFSEWDGITAMVYDPATRTQINLGPGSLGRFSPDSRQMAWTAIPQRQGDPPEVWLLDLESKARRSIGPGSVVEFLGNDRLIVNQTGSDEREIIELRSGRRQRLRRQQIWPSSKQTNLFDGQILSERDMRVPPYPETSWTYVIVSPFDYRVLLSIDAYLARPTRHGEVVIATPPENGTTNIFIVDVATGQATFVATSRFTPPNWPLAASTDFIVWTENYCGSPAGKLRIFDRRTGELIETDRSDWVQLTPGGLLATSRHGFGARALFDPRTWRYTVTIPDLAFGARTNSAGDVSWSPDYRYASRGVVGGHGGLCP